MVRFGVRSMADLIDGNAKKRAAMQEAIEVLLTNTYETWRLHQTQHDQDLRVLHQAHDALRGEVSQLESKLAEVQMLLKAKNQEIAECQEEQQRVDRFITSCHLEKKSYQTSVIKCDQRNYEYEEIEKLFNKCTQRNVDSGCTPVTPPNA